MKILISAYACDPYSGSEPAGGWGWAFYNAQMGNQVICYTRTGNKKSIERYLAEKPVKNLRVEYIPCSKILHAFFKWLPLVGVYPMYIDWQIQAYRKARALHKKEKLDLVHHVSYGSIQLGTYMWKLPIPLIFGPVGGGQHAKSIFKPFFYRNWFMEKIRFLTGSVLTKILPNTKKAIQHASYIPVTNVDTYKLAESLGGKNIDYFLDTGLKPDFAPEEIPIRHKNKEIKVLWLGSMIPRKGLYLVLEVFEGLAKNLPISLSIVGGGPDSAFFQQEIKQRKLGDKITLIGKVPFEEVKEYYRSHDVFMFCSLRDSFGSQLLEAMAYGLPILTLNMHGAEVFVPEDAGIKVLVEDAKSVVEKLREGLIFFMNNPEARAACAKVSFEFAKEETWVERVNKMQATYRTLSQKPVQVS